MAAKRSEAAPVGAALAPITVGGEIIAAHGRHFLVALPSAPRALNCVMRAKRSDCAVGDRVRVICTGDESGVIEAVEPRINVLQRCRGHKTKLLAANVDAMAVVVAHEPQLHEELLLRALAAAAAAGIERWIIATKSDLASERRARFEQRLDCYRALGLPVVSIQAKAAPEQARATLRQRLQGKRTVMVGQSGMGKSTLLNTLVPDAAAATQAISHALDSGRHTTTVTRSFALTDCGANARLIDSPGMQEWGLDHLSLSQAMHALPLGADHGRCRFNNCLHLNEPGCALRSAAQSGRIDPLLYQQVRQIISDLSRR